MFIKVLSEHSLTQPQNIGHGYSWVMSLVMTCTTQEELHTGITIFVIYREVWCNP